MSAQGVPARARPDIACAKSLYLKGKRMSQSVRNLKINRGFNFAMARIAFVLFVLNIMCLSHSLEAQTPVAPNLMVRGYITAVAGGGDQIATVAAAPRTSKAVYLPGVDVYLQDANGAAGRPVKTDLSGRFSIYAPGKGRYHICWKSAVYGAGCNAAFVSVSNGPVFVSAVRISLPRRAGFTAIVGHVTSADGSLPRTFDPFLNINAFATVSLEDSKRKELARVYVNNFGDYLMPYVPIKQKLSLTAAIEAGRFTQQILPEARIEATTFSKMNLKIANNRPRLEPLVAHDSTGRVTQNAAPGSAVTVKAVARDRDGDPIKYVWYIGEGQGTLVSSSGPDMKWELPGGPGRYTAAVVAYDEKGGYDKAQVSVLVGNKGIPFSGVVVEPGGLPVSGAAVEIVGNPVVKTDTTGRFHANVKEESRYVFNVRREGYALNSQVYDHGVTGGTWILRRAQVMTVDPTKPIVVTHKRGERDCTGPISRLAGSGVAGASLNIPQWQDGSGNVVDAPTWFSGPRKLLNGKVVSVAARPSAATQEKQPVILPRQLQLPPCGPGVSVQIPANSILDGSGNPATAPINISISTIDLLSPQQMPGDDSVIPSGGGGGSMESFGAGSLDLPSGFRLKTGTSAHVTIPVDRSRLISGTLPPTVPLLSYNEKTGHWTEEGTLTLTTVAGVRSYVGDVKHFSAFNADNVKTSASACLRVFSPSLPPQYNLEVSAPYQGTGAPKVLTKVVTQDVSGENVIYNLPNNTNITLAPMTLGATPQLLGYYVVNSGPPQNPNSSPNAPAGPPYTSCQNFVILKVGSAPESPFGGEFLHGLGYLAAENLGFDDLTLAGPTGNTLKDAIVTASKNYYTSVDPSGLRDTFDHFKSQNGLSADPATPAAGEIVAQYANSGDLGFGRDMHCLKKVNGDVACYVTNYGTGYNNSFPGDGTSDADDAQAAATRSTVGQSKEVATVAMEYREIEGNPGTRVVKFFVYKKNFPNPGDYNRSISANLDGRGERPVPQLCMVCHGGAAPSESGTPPVPVFGSAAQVNLNARFLPFDYRFFTFDAAATRASQENSFKALNEQIVAAAPPVGAGDPIGEIVSGLYNGGGPPPQAHNFIVPGWANGQPPAAANQAAFYTGVIANGCRGCHTAQPFAQLQFNTADKFINVANPGFPNNNQMLGTAQMRVCGDYTMPHALRTHDIFWNVYPWDVPGWGPPPSPPLPVQFQNFGDGIPAASTAGAWKAGLCSSFVSATVTSPSTFYEQTIQPIWNSKCVACHISGGIAPFSLTEGDSFANLRNGVRVTPPNDAAGTLLQRITATNGLRMPQNCFRPPTPPNGNFPCLDQGDIDKIKAWIRSGGN